MSSRQTMRRWTLIATWTLVVCGWGIAQADVLEEEDVVMVEEPLPASREVHAPPLNFYNWRCTQRQGWRLEDGPRWYSLGHLARVMVFLPQGPRADRLDSVTLQVHEVLAFARDGATPASTRLMQELVIRADDPERLKTRQHWGFRSEEIYNWEMEVIPFKQHQVLERFFLHDDPQVWQTLMIHSEADLFPDDGRMFYDVFYCYVMVFEILHDDRIETVSRFREYYPPPITDWILQREVPAPWALGKRRLEPVSGPVTFDEEGGLVFAPGRPSNWRGWPQRLAVPQPMQQEQPTRPPTQDEVRNLLEEGDIRDLLR